MASIRVGSKMVQRYGKTRADAEKKLEQLLRQYYQGTLVEPTKITLRQWHEQWLDGLDLRPSTRRTYVQVLTPILEDVGHTRLDKLTPILLSLCFTRLQKARMGARRRQLAYTYLKSCLQRAVDLEVIGRNPLLKVERPRWEPKAQTYWSVDETARFVQTCTTTRNPWGPLFATLATCGLRVSEALGLHWSDIDFSTRRLHIRRALVWAGEQWSLVPTKTTSANRHVSLPDTTIIMLSKLLRPTDPEHPVFLNSSGNPPRASQLLKSLRSVCREAGVSKVNVHALRHVHAALAYRAVKDVHAVKQRLGHSDVTTTMRIYSYLMQGETEVAAAVDDLLNGQHRS